MGFFIGVDEQGQCLGHLRQGMILVLADFVDDFIEDGNGIFVLFL